jgi:hypothetical protein
MKIPSSSMTAGLGSFEADWFWVQTLGTKKQLAAGCWQIFFEDFAGETLGTRGTSPLGMGEIVEETWKISTLNGQSLLWMGKTLETHWKIMGNLGWSCVLEVYEG